MLTLTVKDMVGTFAPTASALAAITAIVVSVRVATAQHRNQTVLLKQNLFDKRYAVYLVAEEFLMYVLKVDGSIKLTSDEFHRFISAVEQSKFLFDSDVTSYMEEVNQKALKDIRQKCVRRDHLRTVGQGDPALDIEIIQAIMDLEGPILERRRVVFGPYLQLAPVTKRGSTAPMKLDGWQRLWVVVAAIWLLPVLVYSYSLWPRAADASKADVYARMKPDDSKRLLDYYDVMFAQLGAVPVPPPPDGSGIVALPRPFTVDPSQVRGIQVDPSLVQAILAGPVVDIGGYRLQFVAGVSQEAINQTISSYRTALRRVLTRRQASFVGEALALWILPIVAFYGLGLAVGWVRRGFSVGNSSMPSG